MTTNLKLFSTSQKGSENPEIVKSDLFPNIFELNTTDCENYDQCSKMEKIIEEKEILLKEVHHRVKNNLQLMTSMINLQLSSIEERNSRTHLKIAQSRIKSLSIIHQLLHKSPDLISIDAEEYLYNLASHLLAANPDIREKIKLKISSNNVNFTIDTCVPFGLMVNELLINSIKNYSKKSEIGDIRIYLKDNLNGSYSMIYSDSLYRKNFTVRNHKIIGSEFGILQALISQLEGNVNLLSSKGLTFNIEFKGCEYQSRLNFN